MPCNDNFQYNLVAAANSVVITSKRGNNRFPLFIYLICSRFPNGLLQCAGELIRAGSRARTTWDSFHAGNRFVDIHPFNQTGNTLCVTGTSADKVYVRHFVIYNIKCNCTQKQSFKTYYTQRRTGTTRCLYCRH